MTTSKAAGAIGTPEDDEAGHCANSAGPFLDHQHPHFDSDGQSKQLLTFGRLRAQLAALGYTLDRGAGDDGTERLIIRRWTLSREFRTLPEVAEVLRRVGGQP